MQKCPNSEKKLIARQKKNTNKETATIVTVVYVK